MTTHAASALIGSCSRKSYVEQAITGPGAQHAWTVNLSTPSDNKVTARQEESRA